MTLKLAKLRDRVKRARTQVGCGAVYKLGRGGFNPGESFCWDWTQFGSISRKACDCSGFVAWCLGMRRDQINARKWWSKLLPWIETTMVFRDATGPQHVFRLMPMPTPGCLVVYGDHAGHEGHIAIVTDAVIDVNQRVERITVIDCSSGQSRRTGQAITERDGTFFLRSGAIFCALVEDFA
jgi:hypothetical protein